MECVLKGTKSKRNVGEILCELEELYDELIDTHGLQAGDLMYSLYGHLKIHRPDCFEEYTDKGEEIHFYYGPKSCK
jgi:hypothetical protein